MERRYDAIVIGAGHNGLITAAYLAKAGKKVLVLERRPIVGGAAVTEEVYPGFKYSTCSAIVDRLAPHIIRELNLRGYGLEFLPSESAAFAPLPDSDYLLLWKDIRKTVREIERFSKVDAAKYTAFNRLVSRLTAFIHSLFWTPPPDPVALRASNVKDLLQWGWNFLRLGRRDMQQAIRILPMSVADFLDEWFETEVLKATLATRGIAGSFLGPRWPGTAFLLLYHSLGAWGGVPGVEFVRGGMGSLTQAIAQAAQACGAQLRTQAEVAQVLIRDGKATGVALQGGEEISGTVVISNADPRRTFLKLVDPVLLDPHFLWQVRSIKFRGSSAKVDLSLGELPNFTCLPGDGLHLRGVISISPSLDYLERAHDDAKYGSYSQKPFLYITIPSLTDPSLAPPGRHVMSILAQHAPYYLKDGSWEGRCEEFGDRVIDTLAEYAPNLKGAILHRQVLTPLDLEEIYGLTEGNL
ncbi:MAG: NAD(P)/FAD-dependent oxidoreductase [Chloroflexi bacterium]|nr:NAD(P)/FAD-dependent oxidoreductase [Chloroflexota bacterium]